MKVIRAYASTLADGPATRSYLDQLSADFVRSSARKRRDWAVWMVVWVCGCGTIAGGLMLFDDPFVGFRSRFWVCRGYFMLDCITSSVWGIFVLWLLCVTMVLVFSVLLFVTINKSPAPNPYAPLDDQDNMRAMAKLAGLLHEPLLVAYLDDVLRQERDLTLHDLRLLRDATTSGLQLRWQAMARDLTALEGDVL